jgi:hypothetical protein
LRDTIRDDNFVLLDPDILGVEVIVEEVIIQRSTSKFYRPEPNRETVIMNSHHASDQCTIDRTLTSLGEMIVCVSIPSIGHTIETPYQDEGELERLS